MAGRDWTSIRNEYITENSSLRVLSVKHGVSFQTLKDRSKKETWSIRRKDYRENIVNQTLQNLASQTATNNARKLLKLQAAADKLAAVIEDVIKSVDQFFLHIVTEGMGAGLTQVSERQFKKADTRAIRDMASSIKDLTTALCRLYDIPSMQEQHAMQIATQRLQLDQNKAQAAEGVSEIIVTFANEETRELAE